MSGKIFVISAACGAGKSSLVSAVLEELQGTWPLKYIVTYTTRAPRNTEKQGQDYNFIDMSEFERRISQGFFLEWSNAYTAYYGSPASIVHEKDKGTSCILILDRAGAQAVIQKVPEAVLIWIEVPLEVLKDRLVMRATENSEYIERRLAQSKIEIELECHNPLYHYKIVNDNFQVAKNQLKMILIQELSKSYQDSRITPNASKASN
jgi:guanylate kinase